MSNWNPPGFTGTKPNRRLAVACDHYVFAGFGGGDEFRELGLRFLDRFTSIVGPCVAVCERLVAATGRLTRT